MYLISIILVVCLAGPGWAAVTNWDAGGDGSSWDDSGNWDNGVPVAVDTYYVDIDNEEVVIDSSMAAVGTHGYFGNTAGRTCTLTMTGGSLSAGDTTWFGNNGEGILNISGGTFTVSGGSYNNIVLGQNSGSSGTINMTGGTITVANTLYIYTDAEVNLDGGTINAGTLYISAGLNMDITSGTLILDGDDTSTIAAYVADGRFTAYAGDGEVVYDYNVTNAGKTTVTGVLSESAENPNPINGETNVAIDSNLLTWSPGPWATDHNVYFGTSFSDVNTGSGGTYKGQVDTNSFEPGDYSYSTTYYWRIDEVNDSNSNSPCKGDVWQFTTESAPPPEATNPNPSDDEIGVALDSNLLTWTPGPWATDHNVYFGTSFSDVNTGSGGTYQGQVDTNSFAPGDYSYATDYYWRIDEVNTSHPNSPCKGDVWHFQSAFKPINISRVAETNYHMATFQSHNQKVVSNDNGIFVTYVSQADASCTWHLDRSTNNGTNWSSVYTREIGTRAPAIETDSSNNIYLAHPDTCDGDNPIYFYRFLASSNYTNPSISKHNGHSSDAKHAMAYDASRSKCYIATQFGKLLTVDATDGSLDSATQILNTCGDNACAQYPHLAVDSNNDLHHAWTAMTVPGDFYYSIHYMRSRDGGSSWEAMDGTPISIPCNPDDSGPTTMITYANEVDYSTWLANMLPKGDKIHFCYVAWASPQRIHYMRYDKNTGVREIDTWTDSGNEWKGTDISLVPYAAFFATDDISDPCSPLYIVTGDTDGQVSSLVSTDNGSTWSDHTRTNEAVSTYAIGGCRMVTSDGNTIGTYTTGSPYYVEFISTATPGDPVVTLFEDSFENGQWDSKWTEDGYNDWSTNTERKTDGSYAAKVDNADNVSILTSVAIDVSSYNTVSIDFDWLIESGLDSGEYLRVDTQTDSDGWTEQDSLDGNVDTENFWHNFQDPTFDVTGKDTLQIRFRAHMSSSTEDAFVDDLSVVSVD